MHCKVLSDFLRGSAKQISFSFKTKHCIKNLYPELKRERSELLDGDKNKSFDLTLKTLQIALGNKRRKWFVAIIRGNKRNAEFISVRKIKQINYKIFPG